MWNQSFLCEKEKSRSPVSNLKRKWNRLIVCLVSSEVVGIEQKRVDSIEITIIEHRRSREPVSRAVSADRRSASPTNRFRSITGRSRMVLSAPGARVQSINRPGAPDLATLTVQSFVAPIYQRSRTASRSPSPPIKDNIQTFIFVCWV